MTSENREQLLDDALKLIENSATSRLASRRWPVPLPSKRAALGSYRRLLDNLESEEPGTGARFVEGGDSGRQRRFLLVLLRQLKTRGVWALEKEAARRRRLGGTMEEMLRRTPAGLETPTYEVLKENGPWEVRKYAEFSVVSTARERPVSTDGAKLSSPAMKGAGAFQALAGYIFGKNQEEEKMAMTTPVLSQPSGEMSFVLPSRFWEGNDGVSKAPTPLDDTVALQPRGGGVLEPSDGLLACKWFGGFAGAEEVATQKRALIEDVEADEEWEACGEPVLLQYNDPFTPPWARRNEVALPLRPVAASG